MTCATPPFRPVQNRLGIVARRESKPIMVNHSARFLHGVARGMPKSSDQNDENVSIAQFSYEFLRFGQALYKAVQVADTEASTRVSARARVRACVRAVFVNVRVCVRVRDSMCACNGVCASPSAWMNIWLMDEL